MTSPSTLNKPPPLVRAFILILLYIVLLLGILVFIVA